MKFIIITRHHYEYTSHTYPPTESKNYHNCTMSSDRLHHLNVLHSSCFSNRTLGWQGWCQWPFLPLNSSVTLLYNHCPPLGQTNLRHFLMSSVSMVCVCRPRRQEGLLHRPFNLQVLIITFSSSPVHIVLDTPPILSVGVPHVRLFSDSSSFPLALFPWTTTGCIE